MFVSILVPSEIAAANVGARKKKKKKRNFNPCSKINYFKEENWMSEMVKEEFI